MSSAKIEYRRLGMDDYGWYHFETDTIVINSGLPPYARLAVFIHENKHREQYLSFSAYGKNAMARNLKSIRRSEIVAHAAVLKYCFDNKLWDSLNWTMDHHRR